ncbi:hypothetical protein SISSUDRAFT_529740 [Sistotremastrum suecicum HHB10207 ss-3]|uniref:Uncharacterized protein n=1 Tax=Sistotremastrum suecicum HHB10207 ss-3 TaxID=1314776 RepID=A0A165XTT5_9AGAM|nr:hypothetical protein SISSUDRAFT_529740 [Sistotremastrum suecicum HHB10207 ss-3]
MIRSRSIGSEMPGMTVADSEDYPQPTSSGAIIIDSLSYLSFFIILDILFGILLCRRGPPSTTTLSQAGLVEPLCLPDRDAITNQRKVLTSLAFERSITVLPATRRIRHNVTLYEPSRLPSNEARMKKRLCCRIERSWLPSMETRLSMSSSSICASFELDCESLLRVLCPV